MTERPSSTPHPEPDDYLTVAEVAERLKLNQQTVRNWIDQGKLPAVRVGPRRVRIRRADLDRFLGESHDEPSPEPARPSSTAPPTPMPERDLPRPVIDPKFLQQTWVLSQYGQTMLHVQIFETNLATLLLIAERKPGSTTSTSWRPAVKLQRRAIHLVQKENASGLYRELAKTGKIDVGLLGEISQLVDWRNFLAHSYLRSRVFERSSRDLHWDLQHVQELRDLAQAFQTCTNRIIAEQRKIAATWGLGPDDKLGVPQHAILLAAMEALTRRIFIGDQPRFDPASLESQGPATPPESQGFEDNG